MTPIPPTAAPSAPPAAPVPSTKGRGLLIWGSVMMAVAVFGGALLLSIVGRSLDLNEFSRDVVIEGSEDRLVPGAIEFEVLEPLGDSSSSGEMNVGVAIPTGASPEPECTITSTDSSRVLSSAARTDDVLVSSGNSNTDTVIVVARLEPGTYTAECVMPGEPSAASGVSFTVGRVLRAQEILDEFGSIFGAIAVIGTAGLLFVVGLVLVIVGFVVRSKSKRAPLQPPYPGFPYPPGQYPQPPYPQGQYPQPPYPAGQHPQPPAPVQYPQPQYPGQPEYPQPQYPGQPAPQPEYPGQPAPQYPQPQQPAPQPWTPPPTEQPAGPPEDDGSSGWTVPPSKR